MARHGASPGVQRALGWTDREKNRTEVAHCECGAELRFDVRDPLGLGRSMQQCSDPACAHATPEPMTLNPNVLPGDDQ